MCTAHGKIIHRSIDGKSTDIAAGKEYGIDDVRVG